VNLHQIRFVNWKGYRAANIRFPETDATRNVLLVRGANGAGKTSILEALVLTLFGAQGLDLVGHATSEDRLDISYDRFLERALNTAARGRDARMSVALSFTGGPAERLELERVWHFSAGGRHRRLDEEVLIRLGPEDELVGLPDGEARDEAVREFVARELLPRNLAPFFIFDGEHLDRFAGKDLNAQVRAAAEIVLGAPELHRVAADLRNYARERRRETRRFDEAGLEGLRSELARLEGEEQGLLQQVETAAAAISPVRAARDELVRQIGALHGDSYASFKALFEAREALTRGRADDQDQLRQALSVDLALALSGEYLREAALRQLMAEALSDQWESGHANSAARYAAFLARLEADEGPPLADDLRVRLETAWASVWQTPPAGCAAERRHSHLGESDRLLVRHQLDAVSLSAADSIAIIARRLETTDRAIVEVEEKIARQRGLDERSQSLADQLRHVQEDIARLDAQHRADVQALDGLRAALAPLRQDLGRQLAGAAAAAPHLRAADQADAYAAVLVDLITASLPRSLETLSEDVSLAFRAMAHKDLVKTVSITSDGAVSLLDERGRDVRDRDASAGETQIFAFALMAAIAGAAPLFPIFMDTPFARLDAQHRANVMQHFASLGVPLILFAHASELSDGEFTALSERLAGIIEIVHAVADGDGVSRAAIAEEAALGA
jgi:DNA sulfur modification protein DndD